MRAKKLFTNLATAITLGLAASSAQAAAGGIYFGAGLVNTSYVIDRIDWDGSATGYTIFAGMPINDVISVEGGLINQGTADVWGADLSGDGIQLSVLGNVALQEGFGLYGRIGMYMWNGELKNAGAASGSDDGSDLYYGIGMNYAFSEAFSVRAEYDFIEVTPFIVNADTDVGANTFSVGFTFTP